MKGTLFHSGGVHKEIGVGRRRESLPKWNLVAAVMMGVHRSYVNRWYPTVWYSVVYQTSYKSKTCFDDRNSSQHDFSAGINFSKV
ncbi:unnamed protein product [Nesidiocoris tenuis]|uniref:Uncharacterized protein n=1 Tax=Nesidiocoris tenuis TaxID=355587 RepID=A0A6H5HHX4_9HEMI|nr:unnamed protein product [Nesidiocoris tenuis]